MDDIIKRFCPRYDFDSYEDMKQNFKINVPDDFNFGFDVVDAWADIEPEKLALVWTNDAGDMARYTFKDVKDNSNRAVNFLLEKGIKKGDIVMLVLKQRPEVWFIITALHKIGAIVIPASFQLMKKDYVYRINAAGVKMLITVGDDDVVQHVRDSLPECPNLEYYVTVGDKPVDGAIDYRSVIGGYSTEFERPTDPEKRTVVTDTALLYFSSGTSGMPKMVRHDFSSALGQITTARYWQCVKENKIHMTQTDSGWAKFAWGKIYGQWICGAAVGAYDTEKFHPIDMIEAMERIRPSTFCAPATIYRFLIKEDLSKYDFSYIEHACLAGEPLNPEVFHQIERLTGMRIYEGFGQVQWASPHPAMISLCSTKTARSARTVWSVLSASVSIRVIRPDSSATTGKTMPRWRRASSSDIITPATPHGATATATTGSSAETTMLSSAPATASVRSRSRAR